MKFRVASTTAQAGLKPVPWTKPHHAESARRTIELKGHAYRADTMLRRFSFEEDDA